MNNRLRKTIVDMVYKGKDGHIPSAFSIVDIIDFLYGNVLKFDVTDPEWDGRDIFILSKGHGCLALYVTLAKHGLLSQQDLEEFCTPRGILGEHPDCTRVPYVEASTGSLGHGLPFALGIALGFAIKGMKNRVFILMGDGECHEGTVWEAANVANNLNLGNICAIVDWNGSAAQLMPKDDLQGKWQAFGWQTFLIDGHSKEDLREVFNDMSFTCSGQPKVVIAKTVKGKGVPFVEGHGPWHHRIPSPEEYESMMEILV